MEPAATPTRFIKEISSNSDSLFSNPLATSNYTTSLSTINPFEQSFAAQQQSSPSDPKTPDAILDIAASLNQHDSSTNGVYLPSIQTFSKPLEQGDRKRAGSFGGSEFESTNGESSTNDDDLQLNQDIDNSSSQKRKKSKKDAMDEAKRQQFLERNRVAALKCRQKKKIWIQDLETQATELTEENIQLKDLVKNLSEELEFLKSQTVMHSGCDCL